MLAPAISRAYINAALTLRKCVHSDRHTRHFRPVIELNSYERERRNHFETLVSEVGSKESCWRSRTGRESPTRQTYGFRNGTRRTEKKEPQLALSDVQSCQVNLINKLIRYYCVGQSGRQLRVRRTSITVGSHIQIHFSAARTFFFLLIFYVDFLSSCSPSAARSFCRRRDLHEGARTGSSL